MTIDGVINMGKVTTFIGSQGAGKSSIAGSTAWLREDDLSDMFGGTVNYHPEILLDATPEGSTWRMSEGRDAKIRLLESEGIKAEYMFITRNPKAKATDVDFLKGRYERVYVDTSSANPAQVDNILRASDSIVLVTTAGEGVEEWLDFLKRARDANPDMTLEQVVFNRLGNCSPIRDSIMERAEDLFALDGLDVGHYLSTLPRSTRLREYCAQRIPPIMGAAADMEEGDAEAEELGQRIARVSAKILEPKEALPITDLVRSIEEKEELEPSDPKNRKFRPGIFKRAARYVFL